MVVMGFLVQPGAPAHKSLSMQVHAPGGHAVALRRARRTLSNATATTMNVPTNGPCQKALWPRLVVRIYIGGGGRRGWVAAVGRRGGSTRQYTGSAIRLAMRDRQWVGCPPWPTPAATLPAIPAMKADSM